MRMNTYPMIIRTRPLKERVNISVDPSVHQRFSQFVERNSQSVSAILNDLMAVYCASENDEPFEDRPSVMHQLRLVLMVAERNALHRVVQSIAHAAGLEDSGGVKRDVDEPPDQSEFITEWKGTLGKVRTGVRLTFNLGHEPDIALGQSLLFRGASQCERVILVVPCRLGIAQHVLRATEQAGLEVVGVDALDAVLHQRSRRDNANESAEAPTKNQPLKESETVRRTRSKQKVSKASKQNR